MSHKRYHGRVQLNARRAVSDMGTIVDRVLQHLTALTGCEVEVSLEITAYRREGFEQDTMRTVTENSRTLKFENYGFEQD